MSQASVAQQFYKIRNKWETIDDENWSIAVWVCDYADIDIINKFMDIEASPIGVFEDIFFQFQSIYKNDETFEELLWKEFLAWFETGENKKYDMIGALKKDRYLPQDYEVNKNLTPTFKSVLTELLRLKSYLPLDENNFILYFLPSMHDSGFQNWLLNQLQNGLPKNIKLAALDVKDNPKLVTLRKQTDIGVVQLPIKLDMVNAVRNEMDKDSTKGNPNDPGAKFQKQVRVVMDATVDKSLSIQKEANELVKIAKIINNISIEATAYMVNGTAFHSLKMKPEAMESVEKSISLTADKFDSSNEAYPIWRSAMMIKAALLVSEKRKQEEALVCYQEIADKATKNGDAYYAMEAYRVRAQMFYHKRKRTEAWENAIFSLQAGTNIEINYRRASSFLYSAALALQIAEDNSNQKQVNTLKEKFLLYIGEDWQTQLESVDVTSKKMKPLKPTKV